MHNPNNTASHSEANELQQAVISAHKIAKSFSRSLSLILSLSGSLQHTLIMALHTNEYLKSSIDANQISTVFKQRFYRLLALSFNCLAHVVSTRPILRGFLNTSCINCGLNTYVLQAGCSTKLLYKACLILG